MHPALEILFALGANKVADKIIESVDEVVSKNLPSDADVLIGSPQAWMDKRKAERSLQMLKLDIDEKIDRLALICQAMWELTIENSNISQQDLLNKTRKLGLFTISFSRELENIPKKCVKCGKTVSPKYKKCIYCGSSEFLDSTFKIF